MVWRSAFQTVLDLDELIAMRDRGEMPQSCIIAYVVKHIAQSGTRADFDNLPDTLKHDVLARVTR
jgi:hypothetical protein